MTRHPLTRAQLSAAKAAYEAGLPSTALGPTLGVIATLMVKKLRTAGATIRPKGSAQLAPDELRAFELGVRDGLPLDGPEAELGSGMTWDDPRLNELYDLGVNFGAVIRGEVRTAQEATVTLSLSEYEAGVLTGALRESADRWGQTYEGHAGTAHALREQVLAQLPEGWRDWRA